MVDSRVIQAAGGSALAAGLLQLGVGVAILRAPVSASTTAGPTCTALTEALLAALVAKMGVIVTGIASGVILVGAGALLYARTREAHPGVAGPEE